MEQEQSSFCSNSLTIRRPRDDHHLLTEGSPKATSHCWEGIYYQQILLFSRIKLFPTTSFNRFKILLVEI